MTFDLPVLQAGQPHLIESGKLGSFYDSDIPAVVVALEMVTSEIRYPLVRQFMHGIELRFDSTFSGGKVKIIT